MLDFASSRKRVLPIRGTLAGLYCFLSRVPRDNSICPSTSSNSEIAMPRFLSLLALVLLLNSSLSLGDDGPQSTKDKADIGFVKLFNGKDLSGWKHSGNWKVADGVITRSGRGGSLVYTTSKVPDDFELRFEWKVAKGSNSGIYYRPTQYEYQILDNAVHKDGKNPRTSAASLYFCMQPSKDVTKPAGQWNSGRVVCKGSVIQHWLNGEKVVDLDYKDPKYAFHVDLLKKRGGNLEARGANLNLQDHGDPVWYRNIRIRELAGGAKLDRTPVKPAEIPAAALAAEKEKLDGIVKRREAAAKKKK